MTARPVGAANVKVNVKVHQIYYNEVTRQQLDPCFLPLDNTANPRPDWYEFWSIRQYLKNNVLDGQTFYGFVSPKFGWKTGLSGQDVLSFAASHPDDDMLLISPGWDQIAYFLNPFEQGEYWHPGLLAETQKFIDQTPFALDLKTHIGHTHNTCFSNYVLAKPRFWQQWVVLADLFFDYVEHHNAAMAEQQTSYGNSPNLLPMKTFIQERFVSIILASGDYPVAAYDLSPVTPIWAELFGDHPQTRLGLETCNALKKQYCDTKNTELLDAYWAIRQSLPLRL
jgi:hypothetical protein